MTESIVDVVLASLSGLKRLSETIRDSDDTSMRTSLLPRLDDQMARLKVWAGNSGAHRTGRASLEHRLRDASHIRQQVLSLLSDLNQSLEDAIDIVTGKTTPWEKTEDGEEPLDGLETETEMEQIVLDIKELVDCLLRLSVSIQNPAPHDRFVASKFTDTSIFEDFDIQHVQSKFRDIDESLAKRLGKAMSRRRQYFRYREAHHVKLSHGLDRHVDMNKTETTLPAPSTLASSIPLQMKQEVPIDILGDDSQSDGKASATSFATSVSGPKTLKVPPMPEDALKGPFLCPFCYLIISVQDTMAWKKHVFGDLRPYNCLALHCTAPDREFSRRNEWMQHMLQDHLRVYRCPLGCSEHFSSAAESRGHLLRAHVGAIPESKVDSIVELSSQPLTKDAHTDCPFCPEKLKSLKQYRRHVGNHQQDLALFVLPSTADEDDDSEESHSMSENESANISLSAHDEEPIETGVQNDQADIDVRQSRFPRNLDRNLLASKNPSVPPNQLFSSASRVNAGKGQLPDNLSDDHPPLRGFTPSPPRSVSSWYDEPSSTELSDDETSPINPEQSSNNAVSNMHRRPTFNRGQGKLTDPRPLRRESDDDPDDAFLGNLDGKIDAGARDKHRASSPPDDTDSSSKEGFLRQRTPSPDSSFNACRNCRLRELACLRGGGYSVCWHCKQEDLDCITDGIPDRVSRILEPATYPENQDTSSQGRLPEMSVEATHANHKETAAKVLNDYAWKDTNEIAVPGGDVVDEFHQNDKGWSLAKQEDQQDPRRISLAYFEEQAGLINPSWPNHVSKTTQQLESEQRLRELLEKGIEDLREDLRENLRSMDGKYDAREQGNSNAQKFTDEYPSDSWEAIESKSVDSAIPKLRPHRLYFDEVNNLFRSTEVRNESETINNDALGVNHGKSYAPPDVTATPHSRERGNGVYIDGERVPSKGTKRRSKKERKLISKLGFETVECPVPGCKFESDFPNRRDFERHFRAWHHQNEDLITNLDALSCPNAYCKGMVAYTDQGQFRGHMRRVHVVDVKPEGKSSVGKAGSSDGKRDRQKQQKT